LRWSYLWPEREMEDFFCCWPYCFFPMGVETWRKIWSILQVRVIRAQNKFSKVAVFRSGITVITCTRDILIAFGIRSLTVPEKEITGSTIYCSICSSIWFVSKGRAHGISWLSLCSLPFVAFLLCIRLAHDPKGSPPSSQARVLEAFDVRSQMLRLEPWGIRRWTTGFRWSSDVTLNFYNFVFPRLKFEGEFCPCKID